MRLYLNSSYDDPGLAAQRDSAIAFARLCLPQVFFYGMFVLLGQVLNARGRFGPMMWAPIANNVIAILVLVAYLVWFGPLPSADQCAAFTGTQELVLGLGATLGIVVQTLVLLPYLKAAGVRFRARYDFRHTGLGAHPAARRLDRAVRDRQPGRLHRGRPARVRRHRARRLRPGPRAAGLHGLHRLRRGLPVRDGAARDHHRLAGDRDPAAPLRQGLRRRPVRAGRHPGRHACAPPWPSSSRSPSCCRSWRTTPPRSSSGTAPPRRPSTTTCRR